MWVLSQLLSLRGPWCCYLSVASWCPRGLLFYLSHRFSGCIQWVQYYSVLTGCIVWSNHQIFLLPFICFTWCCANYHQKSKFSVKFCCFKPELTSFQAASSKMNISLLLNAFHIFSFRTRWYCTCIIHTDRRTESTTVLLLTATALTSVCLRLRSTLALPRSLAHVPTVSCSWLMVSCVQKIVSINILQQQ